MIDECEHPEDFVIFDSERSERTCTKCAVVLEDRIPVLTADADSLPLRVNAGFINRLRATSSPNLRDFDPPNYPNGSIFFVDAKSRKHLNPTWRKKGKRLFYYQQISKEPHTKMFHKQEIRVLCTLLNASQPIIVRASYLFEKYAKTVLVDFNGYYAGAIAILIACREHKFPTSIKTVCNLLRLRGRKILDKRVKCGVGLVLASFKVNQREKAIRPTAEEYLPTFLNKLKEIKPNIDNQLMMKKGQEILQKIPQIERGSRNPVIFAVAVLYAISRELKTNHNLNYGITQTFLANKFNVAGYSVRDHWKFILSKIA
jgi:transcription initiation factor TFIIIB Brf1 subunit/transcription initiation factor TFIIB